MLRVATLQYFGFNLEIFLNDILLKRKQNFFITPIITLQIKGLKRYCFKKI